MWNGIEQLLLKMKQYTIEEYYAAFPVMEEWLKSQERLLMPKDRHRTAVINLCENLALELHTYPSWMKIHLLSFCMKCSEERKYAEWLMQEILDTSYEELGEYNKYFLYWQVGSSIFGNANLQSETLEKGRIKLYRELYQLFYEALDVKSFSRIPVEQRNQELVFIFTSQFLTEVHAPTKTVCDRAYYLQHHLGKKTVIINTAMMIPQKGDTPFYHRSQGGYLKEYSKMSYFKFRDETFEFFQCGADMPDPAMMQKLLRRVSEEKPYCVLNIGGGDICADLCGSIVPEITVSTVFSGISTSCGDFQIISSNLKDEDYELLRILGVKAENIVKTLFTFVFKKQVSHYTRRELGLREDSFILLVIGWRLAQEVREDFLQMMEELALEENSLELVFMGLFEDYRQTISSYPSLMKKSHYLEYQSDALAVTECCDLYVNPKRKGGGTSCAEALSKGLPVVTLPFGDVAAAAGESFWMDNYTAMKEKIERYCRDKKYYEKMSELAKNRAKDLTDSKTHFCEAFQKIEQKVDFQ